MNRLPGDMDTAILLSYLKAERAEVERLKKEYDVNVNNLLDEVERLQDRVAELERRLFYGVFLPEITSEVLEELDNEPLIELTDKGPQWTQNAVEFAVLLNRTLKEQHPAMQENSDVE